MPKDNNGDEIVFRSILDMVEDSQPIFGPRTRPPDSVWVGTSYGVVGQAVPAGSHAQLEGIQMPRKDAVRLKQHGEKRVMPAAPSLLESVTPRRRMPLFGSMSPSPHESSSQALSGNISPVTSDNPITPSPASPIVASNRQQPITFPLTPPSTNEHPGVVAPSKLSTIKECDTEDERTPPRGRGISSLISKTALTPTPNATPIEVMLGRKEKARLSLHKESLTQARSRQADKTKGSTEVAD
ncbi:hypothetical protein A1O1_05177 [Capronia coronata CBS 617.96]|uniref:Uncharacterized protein n=1 Tax=Capronia coronata CBS 617.96 TaxID=1182541 RepID=W9Y5Y7_9EURO|nr:uncharacterized protein A1O1_05177 [Capronia coronata CBS 617.96]EXJ88247.1 hypothetical protein A1O1_05177 [Capronia coronata CBS 617.96]